MQGKNAMQACGQTQEDDGISTAGTVNHHKRPPHRDTPPPIQCRAKLQNLATMKRGKLLRF
jgi:hypothetical protein